MSYEQISLRQRLESSYFCTFSCIEKPWMLHMEGSLAVIANASRQDAMYY